MNKKLIVALAMSLALAGSTAFAAELANGSGQSCGDDPGTWHFVNNQTDQTTFQGTLTAEFSSGGPYIVLATKVLRNVQHFFVVGPSGMLLDAYTNLPGRLVLSDFSCDAKSPPTK